MKKYSKGLKSKLRYPLEPDETEHLKTCKRDACHAKEFFKLKHKWAPSFPTLQLQTMPIDIDALKPDKKFAAMKTWIGTDKHDMICIPCSCVNSPDNSFSAGNGGALNANFMKSSFERHHRSKRHINNVKTFLGIEVGISGNAISGAPSV